MKIMKLWKTAAIAALVGVGSLAAANSADAQARFRFDYNSGPSSYRECNRFGDCYTVTCNRNGRNCYRSNYYRSNNYYGSGYNNYRPGRYWVCDRRNRCAYAPYPRSYYQRYPRAGFSFGFSF